MATIGLDQIHYALLTEVDNAGVVTETYAVPKYLAKAVEAEIAPEFAEGLLYGDDGIAENIKEFVKATIKLGLTEVPALSAKDIYGARIDSVGGIVKSAEDIPAPHALLFRSKKANGKYRYCCIYKATFSPGTETMKTKGESIEFSSPTIEGIAVPRSKPDADGRKAWIYALDEDDPKATPAVISKWFTTVPEPNFTEIIQEG